MSIMFYHLITFYISRRYVGCNMYAPSHDAGMIAWGWISVVIRQGITASPMSTRWKRGSGYYYDYSRYL